MSSAPLQDDAKADYASADGKATASAEPNDPSYAKLGAIMLVMLSVGAGVAYGTLFLDSDAGKNARDAKLEIVTSMDLVWVYAALVLLGRTIAMLNFVPTGYKNGLDGNVRSNPFFYETSDGKLVLYKEDGFHGKYNRANRSVQHMLENSGAFWASIGPVGWIYPRQTFGCVVAFCVGRLLHQKGYTDAYGKHAPGFILQLLSILTMEGLALLTCLL